MLFKKGLAWVLGNGESIKFLYDNWMDESPVINKVLPDKYYLINHQGRVCDFLSMFKTWNIVILRTFYILTLLIRSNKFLFLFPILTIYYFEIH